jgi:hypothetical protein
MEVEVLFNGANGHNQVNKINYFGVNIMDIHNGLQHGKKNYLIGFKINGIHPQNNKLIQ